MLNFLAYLFLDSTLLNNYRAIYLVNSKEILVPGLFRKLGVTDFVDVRFTGHVGRKASEGLRKAR
jgi:hypothetical protein